MDNVQLQSLINNLLEVGGLKKNSDRIADVDNSYLAVDDTEVGHGHRIPLWLFDFIF